MGLGREWVLAGVIASGAVVGVGVGVATGGSDGIPVLASVSTYDCPAGSAVGDLRSGDRILATGRDDSGNWLEVRAPTDQGARVWVEARYVAPDGETADLDVRSCDEVGEVAFAPNADLPADAVTTTTVPGAAASGDGPADTAGPTITSASVTPGEIWELDGGGLFCDTPPRQRQATVAASATDPSGIASITASWPLAGGNPPKSVPATFGPFPYKAAVPNPPPTTVTVTITITARDTAGNVSTTTRQVVVHSTDECLG